MTKWTKLLTTLILASTATISQADELMVAVAANFTAPMKRIVEQYQQETGDEVKVSFGSSGKLLAQIRNGAPFDIFLSADQKKPIALEESGDAVSGSRFTYAKGTLVLWSADNGVNVEEKLKQSDYSKLSLANPRLAPYGEAATEVMDKLGLNGSKGSWVMGENINQAWQYVASGNAQLGFVAMSQIMQDGKIISGSSWVVPETMYSPIRQDAVLLKSAADKPAAKRLLQYLRSEVAKQQILAFGYSLDS
ncbi:molybdate ABC transporter substrate-binding protein [Oceanobacter mangrovi]|uniref:molybdate ABC transporter substrate-binding protein n=1 Tax=Oceanobacter mangrovi TaxID=2862510 RepID=UPI001C8E4AB5|nr:molybdate ABC transporter substrate-binding protein [Oceanobacter mangrovi]